MNIDAAVISHEPIIRIAFFAAIFAIVSIAELFKPRRILTAPKQKRWINNLLLSLTGTVISRIIFPIFPVGVALFCVEKKWGLLNYYHFPPWIALICGIVLLDLTIYLQHMMFHLAPVFWRLHKVHHIDQDIDVTTGLRFHPLEIILSMMIKISVVAAIGASPVSVVIFEILLNGTTMFNHGNLNIPRAADSLIRLLIVTPDMHRVHHSVIRKETNSNYGFNFSWWDRIFNTYKKAPDGGHEHMKIGLNGYHELKYLQLLPMLTVPFETSREY
ncbi:MAG: sterol desaturase family protein [Smithella sp.]